MERADVARPSIGRWPVASNAAEKSFTISGFKAPTPGTVNVNVSAIAYEGDRGTTGDYMKLNNTQLGTALSPGSNFFDSAIGFTGRTS